MKTRLIIPIIGITIVSGILVSTSGIFTPLESELAECSYTDDNGPPRPCRIIDGWYDALFYSEPLPLVEPEIISDQKCAELFDKIFDTWEKYVEENIDWTGQSTLEPPTVAGIVLGWEGGEEFRNTDCRYKVNDWAYLVKHQEQVWGYVDWPKLEPFKYEPKPEDERKIFCETHGGKWSEEFHNCVGGSMETSCDDIGASGSLVSVKVFGKTITQEENCVSHELFCKSMGGNSTCMSDEQKGHGRDICIAVCEFE